MKRYYVKNIPHPKVEGLRVTFEAMQEDLSPNGQFEFQEDIDHINSEIEAGNDAAWFCAKVTTRLDGADEISASEYLGGCSYKKFQDFMEDVYFKNMVETTTHNLIHYMRDTSEEIKAALERVDKMNETVVVDI